MPGLTTGLAVYVGCICIPRSSSPLCTVRQSLASDGFSVETESKKLSNEKIEMGSQVYILTSETSRLLLLGW